MLDVHPPHTAVHGWRDFFVHIATIVVGLLIAVALEQTVEHIHNRLEVSETRAALQRERKSNIHIFHENVRRQRESVAGLQNDIRIFQYLQQHPGAATDELPGMPVWEVSYKPVAISAWDAAQHSDVLGRMPGQEASDDRNLYAIFARFELSNDKAWEVLNVASQYQFTQPDVTKLTPAQIGSELEMLNDCLRERYLTLLMLENISRNSADFAPGPTEQELDALHHQLSWADQRAKWPHAQAYLDRDIRQADAVSDEQTSPAK